MSTTGSTRSLSRTKGTKTHQVRDIDLNDLAMAALTAQKAHSFMKGQALAVREAPA
jgi:hypothetical protein